jgi:7,8-dihydropterin-6-yl-methyl-4-(beta-D-ribofuranosyl)aminobenzene 5'-phosphate synthase
MIGLYAVIAFALIILGFLTIQINRLKVGKRKVAVEQSQIKLQKISSLGSVKRLSILPLVDFYSDRETLKTEPGVSYLIRADDTTILLDVGFNAQKANPSPLLENMKTLSVAIEDIDILFLSHLHMDHLGGMTEHRTKTFSLSQGPVDLSAIPVYAPDRVSPSHWNPAPKVEVVREPKVIKRGIASIGVYPRFLFLVGHTLEHSLAINVEGKGLVLIIGCGHQTIERIIERVQTVFDVPVYAIIGGLHFPVKGGRIMKGPFNIQHIIGSDNPPWKGLAEKDVRNAIEAVKRVHPRIISLSPHDSSDWSIAQFREAFQGEYIDLKVGKEILL